MQDKYEATAPQQQGFGAPWSLTEATHSVVSPDAFSAGFRFLVCLGWPSSSAQEAPPGHGGRTTISH